MLPLWTVAWQWVRGSTAVASLTESKALRIDWNLDTQVTLEMMWQIFTFWDV